MKVILDIKDEKVPFILELLKNFDYVKAIPLTSSKADVLEGVKEAVDEVKLIRQGKLKGISARELLNEL